MKKEFYLFKQNVPNKKSYFGKVILSVVMLCIAAFTYAQEVGPELIKNGDFKGAFNNKAGTIQDWGTEVKKNVFVVDDEDYKTGIAKTKVWHTPPQPGERWAKMKTKLLKRVNLFQPLEGACGSESKVLEFDIVFDSGDLGSNTARLDVSVNNPHNSDNVILFNIAARKDKEYTWWIENIKSGVEIKVTKEQDTKVYVNNELTVVDALHQYDQGNKNGSPLRYHVTVEIGGEAAQEIVSDGELLFKGDKVIMYYFFTNISLKNKAPVAEEPTVVEGATSCPEGTYDLSQAEPTLDGHTFEWYSDAEGTQLVTDKNVSPGTYYMKTVSSCSGLKSKMSTSFVEVRQSCPEVNGTLFRNYDGGDFTGNPGTNGGGMFAHWVDVNNVVVNAVSIADDGSYSMLGVLAEEEAENFQVIINNEKIDAGGTLTKSKLNPTYVYAGTTDKVYPGNGVSDSYPIPGEGQSKTIDFGVQELAIPGNKKIDAPNQGAGVAHRIGELNGKDDDPEWNKAIGKTIIVKSITTTTGKLQYDGEDVILDKEYENYDPEKLVFIPSTDGDADVKFVYKCRDRAGAISYHDGNVICILSQPTSIVNTVNDGVHIYADGVGNVVVQNAGDEALDIQFFDLSGRLVVQRTVRDNELARIPMQANGMYIVKAVGSKINHTERVIVR